LVSEKGKNTWAIPEECVWDAPTGFRSKHQLKSLYGDNADVAALFQIALGISSATIQDIIRNIKDTTPGKAYLEAVYDYMANEFHEHPSESLVSDLQ
jgi:hypothetical protein